MIVQVIPLSLISAVSYGILAVGYLADIAPGFAAVIVAIVGATASIVNTFLITSDRTERRKHQDAVRKAIDENKLVAMIPENVVRDIENS